ncbi:aspartyl protease family protein [uncultured Maribacter sp.]|uniref:aspartyl protease family protein n=1 Tax=uncultured Maribacter sp. TaxID=431308 RepID=UPI002627FF4C|nr:aspartyl protease family protein [uncultured Maribacter sp.]
MRYSFSFCMLLIAFFFSKGFSQTFSLPTSKKSQKVKFQLINNLIIMPIEVNGTELSFILDSGVQKPILFNLSDRDSVQINNVSEISIRGLGKGEPIKGLSSIGNTFKLGDIKNSNQHLYVVLDKDLNLSSSIGIPIHGIIGYDLFKDFIVDINYSRKVIKFYSPENYVYKESKKSEILPINIIKKKVYVGANVYINGKENLPVKMLVDTGSSDAVWLFEDENINVPQDNYEDFLGKGLGGDIFGRRTKINSIRLGTFSVKDAKTAFPDIETFNSIKRLGNRNGSVGGEILKRFNIVFDYRNKKMTIRKNGNFNKAFQYNLSGIDLQHDGVRYVSERIANTNGLVKKNDKYFGNVQILLENTTRLSLVPEIVVSGIRMGSPAEAAGLQQGDVILAVNGKRIHKYKIQEVLQMLNDKEGKRIEVLIERYNQDVLFSFVLKNLFK